jgi:hypothetical protein
MRDTHRLDLELHPRAVKSRVLLDGKVVEGVTKVTVTAEVGHVTRVDLETFVLHEPHRFSFEVKEVYPDASSGVSSETGLRFPEEAGGASTKVSGDASV